MTGTLLRRAPALVLLAVFALAGCGGGATPPSSPSATATPAGTAAAAKVAPAWVDIPSIGARSSLVPLGLNADRSVQVPPVDQPLQAGWYRYSPAPGDPGPAVILGHIDGNHQEGIFWRLHEVKAGDQIQVGRQDGRTLTFTVSKVAEVAKDAFPTTAVYGETPDPQLRLITCGGAFDASAHSYVDNVIVYAKLAS